MKIGMRNLNIIREKTDLQKPLWPINRLSWSESVECQDNCVHSLNVKSDVKIKFNEDVLL